MNIPIIYQDDHILVLNKPPGVVVDRSETQSTGTIEDFLRDELKIPLDRGGIVHRLDKDTSGILLVAKNQAALEALQSQFKDRETKKEYLALVHGVVKADGEIVGPIMRNPLNRETFIVSPDGKEAVTGYKVEKQLLMNEEKLRGVFEGFNKIQFRKLGTMSYEQFSLVRCFPKTGRTHQLRVHLKHIGHEIVGDEKYGGRKITRLDRRWCPRQFLHAERLEFTHPESGERVNFTAPLPEDLQLALSFLDTN